MVGLGIAKTYYKYTLVLQIGTVYTFVLLTLIYLLYYYR